MKRILGLCMVALMSLSLSVFAQDGKRDRNGWDRMDDSKRMDKVISDLNLNENQQTDFRRINNQFMEQMKQHRGTMERGRELTQEQRDQMDAMMHDRNEKIRSILNEDQYLKYMEMQKNMPERQRGNRPNI